MEEVTKFTRYDQFQITGRGTVVTVHKDDHDWSHITHGSKIQLNDNKVYVVRGIETFRNGMGKIGKNAGFLIKEYEEEQSTQV